MTGQQLRNSILQEAIHGRLVPNVLQPGEKTGDDLLKDILAERQKKENDEKGKKARRLTLSIIEDEPWELPEGWCWCKLNDICTITAGQSPEGNEINEQEGVEFHQGKIFFDDLYLKEASIFTKRVTKIAHKDSVLLCMRAPVGVVNITPREICIGRGLSAIEPINPISSLFLCYWLRSYKDYYEDRATGSTFKAITGDIVKNTPIPLPPLSIQKAIVEKIEELLPLIDEYDKAAVELETLNKILPDKLRKSVLQEAIHGTLVLNDIPEGEATGVELLQQILKERQDRENKEKGKKAKKLTLSTIEEEPWELPEGWCWCLIKDICEVKGGKRIPAGRRLSDIDTGYKYIRVSDMKNGSINTNDLKYVPIDIVESIKRYTISKDDIYITVAGTIGDVGTVPIELDGANLTENADKLVFSNTNIEKMWLYSFLRSSFIKQQIKDVTTKVGQPKLAINKIEELMLPFPPLSIQQRIVEKIEEVFSAINKLQA